MTHHIDIQKIRDEEKRVSGEVRERLAGSIVAAFGVVVGLAWNDAVTTFISAYFPFGKSGILAKFIYALFLTLVVSILAYYVSRLITKKEKEIEKKADKEVAEVKADAKAAEGDAKK